MTHEKRTVWKKLTLKQLQNPERYLLLKNKYYTAEYLRQLKSRLKPLINKKENEENKKRAESIRKARQQGKR